MTHMRGKGQRNTWIQSKCTKKNFTLILRGEVYGQTHKMGYMDIYIF